MSEQLETILDMVGANYQGCHNCKFNTSENPSSSRECKICIPTNWKPDSITAMDKELSTILENLGDDYTGCHNCKFLNPNVGWDSRTNECKICVMSNWEANKYTNMKLDR